MLVICIWWYAAVASLLARSHLGNLEKARGRLEGDHVLQGGKDDRSHDGPRHVIKQRGRKEEDDDNHQGGEEVVEGGAVLAADLPNESRAGEGARGEVGTGNTPNESANSVRDKLLVGVNLVTVVIAQRLGHVDGKDVSDNGADETGLNKGADIVELGQRRGVETLRNVLDLGNVNISNSDNEGAHDEDDKLLGDRNEEFLLVLLVDLLHSHNRNVAEDKEGKGGPVDLRGERRGARR